MLHDLKDFLMPDKEKIYTAMGMFPATFLPAVISGERHIGGKTAPLRLAYTIYFPCP